MKKVIGAFFIAGLLVVSGCKQQPTYHRYPYLEVPEYSLADYYKLLSDKNPEIVYNALCNLVNEADTIAATLSDEKADPADRKYVISLSIFEKTLSLLKSRDPKILAASLKFLEVFGAEYKKAEDLIQPILKVKSKDPNVKYEQIMALSVIASEGSSIDDAFLRRRLKDKSWLVSRSTYVLINSLQHDELRLELIKRYDAESNTMEKLLILGALTDNFPRKVFKFLTREMIFSDSPKIKRYIFAMLGFAQDKRAVLGWFDRGWARLAKPDIAQLAEIHYTMFKTEFSSTLLAILIQNGFSPSASFLNTLNTSMKKLDKKEELSQEEKVTLNNISRIEQALLASDLLHDTWIALKEEKAEPPAKTVNPDLKREYDKAVDAFIASTATMLRKYEVDEESRKSFLEEISGLKDYLVERLGR
jgi:hypothetical protein